MKQYAGNWASGTFSFRDKSMEDRINERIVKAADNQIDQIEPLFGKEISEIFIQKAVAFRMMHPMGRMHISALMRHTDSARRSRPTRRRVRQQRPHRVELRRRPLPRRAPDRRRCRSDASTNRATSWWRGPSRSRPSARRCSTG